jgi:hypothetical protein
VVCRVSRLLGYGNSLETAHAETRRLWTDLASRSDDGCSIVGS